MEDENVLRDKKETRLERLRVRLMEEMSPENVEEDAEIMRKITALVAEEHQKSPMPLAERSRLAQGLFSSVRGLGLLQELVDDPEVTEIMVNGPANVFVEKKGHIYKWERAFASEEKLMDLVRQVAGKCDRVINEQSPVVDARLADGSRVCAVVPPVSLGGAALSIRKFPDQPITMDGLVRLGTISGEAAGFLARLVRSGYSVLIGGGTSAGKTTFLNALSACIPREERVITVEDNAELRLQGLENLVRLEAKSANLEGASEVTIRDLVRASLRMRPDRIVVGEVRGGEAVDLLQALNTGHDGSLSTIHANSAEDMISRLEMMVLMAFPLPLPAIRRQIASGVEIMVHLRRQKDGRRRVAEIAETDGMSGENVRLRQLYVWDDAAGALKKTGELLHSEKLRQGTVTGHAFG